MVPAFLSYFNTQFLIENNNGKFWDKPHAIRGTKDQISFNSFASSYEFRLHDRLIYIGTLATHLILHNKGENNNTFCVILQS